MIHLGGRLIPLAAVLLSVCCSNLPDRVNCLQQQQQQQQQIGPPNGIQNFPYYMASPVADLEPQQNQMQGLGDGSLPNQVPLQQQQQQSQINQRTLKQQQQQQQQKLIQSVRKLAIDGQSMENQLLVNPQPQVKPPLPPIKDTCLYDKRYFAKFDECLAKKPYPTVGLLAFKNEDLLTGRESHNKHGCVFVLNNGLFKNYQISRYFVDSEEQCLDNSKVSLSMSFTNVTLSYLWTLRCLNRADQMLDDATMSGRTVDPAGAGEQETQQASICIGSSQNFGFASLQLTNIEAQVDMVTDIYKNWRVTNVTVSMVSPAQSTTINSTSRSGTTVFPEPSAGSHQNGDAPDFTPLMGTSIKDYVFETLDGDELNWRYLHLFQNWSRNRMHTSFLNQYRRFLWISLQRCLAESSEKLPTKLMDIFTNQKFS